MYFFLQEVLVYPSLLWLLCHLEDLSFPVTDRLMSESTEENKYYWYKKITATQTFICLTTYVCVVNIKNIYLLSKFPL